MSEVRQLKYLQLALQIGALSFISAAVYNGWWFWLQVSLIAYLTYGFLGVTIGYHRMLAHNSFETYAPIRYLLIFCGMLCTIASPLTNTLVHRSHHKHTDTEKDPHSPVGRGVLTSWFSDWTDYVPHLELRLIKKELKDPFFKFTHKYYVPILLMFSLVLTLIDWKIAAYAYCIPAACMFHLKGLFNVAGHQWGYRNYDTTDESRNSWFMHVMTLGDGLHNNHHMYPTRWNTQIKWWEIDPAAWVIWLIKKPRRGHDACDLSDVLKAATKK